MQNLLPSLSAVLLLLSGTAVGQSSTKINVLDGQAFTGPLPTSSGGSLSSSLGSGLNVDTVGSTSSGSSGPMRAKGNSYRIDTSTTLREAEFWLDFTSTQQLTFYVFDGAAEFGVYNEVYRASANVAGVGAGWYSSSTLNTPLNAGRHYIIAVSWNGTAGYSFGVGDSETTSFGSYVHGYATGNDPLPMSFSSNTNDQAIYHQRITTGAPSDPGSAYCFGDGSGASCPCSAFGAIGTGCANTAGGGATLAAAGNASVGNDTFQLDIAGVPGAKPGLVLRGDSQVAVPAGDGILCTTGATLRSHVQVTVAGATTFTDFNGAPFGSVANAPGTATNFQFWYRDSSNPCSGGGFNFTNGWTVTYTP